MNNKTNWRLIEVRAWYTALFILAGGATWTGATWFFGAGW